jgi:hypothetical protein
MFTLLLLVLTPFAQPSDERRKDSAAETPLNKGESRIESKSIRQLGRLRFRVFRLNQAVVAFSTS